MSKIKLNALSPEEQLDVLSRVYIRECTKPINKWLSGAIRHAGGEYETQLNLGKVKNMFLCGSMRADDYGYAVGNTRYESNRFSTIGGFYNYLYRSRLINELRNDYRVERGISRAYSHVAAYGYTDFYAFVNNAYLPSSPSSVIDEASKGGESIRLGYALDEELSTSSLGLEDFSKDQIAVIKKHIKKSLTKEMTRQGFSAADMETIMEEVDRMRTTPYFDKRKGQPPVKKPSEKLKGFLISEPCNVVDVERVEVKTPVPTPKKEVVTPVVDVSDEKLEELGLIRELDEEESVILYPCDAYDKYGNPLARNQKGLYCNLDGTPFRGDAVYDELGSIYEDLESGLVYGAKERDMDEEDEELAIQIVGNTRYTSNGHMIAEDGRPITLENGYTDQDVQDTMLGAEEEGPVQLQFDLDQGQNK